MDKNELFWLIFDDVTQPNSKHFFTIFSSSRIFIRYEENFASIIVINS
jgi:hypothetical protein